MLNLIKQVNRLILPVEIQKNCLLEAENLNRGIFEKVILSLSYNDLPSEDDPRLVEAIFMLESISGQKVFVQKGDFVYVGSKKVYIATLTVTLRGSRMVNFVEYCAVVLFPNYKRRQGVIEFEYLNDAYMFTLAIDDYNSFFNLRHKLGKGKLHIIFVSPQPHTKSLLKALGFPLK